MNGAEFRRLHEQRWPAADDRFAEEIAEAARTHNLDFFRTFRTLPRGAGTTHKQVAATPDGSIYLVKNSGTRSHVQAILEKQGRSPAALSLRVISTHGDLDRLRGLNQFIAIDHDVWRGLDGEKSDILMMRTQRNNARYEHKQTARAPY